MLQGRKIGTIYANMHGEGFIVWDDEFIEGQGSVFNHDVLQDVGVEIGDALDDTIECEEHNRSENNPTKEGE